MQKRRRRKGATCSSTPNKRQPVARSAGDEAHGAVAMLAHAAGVAASSRGCAALGGCQRGATGASRQARARRMPLRWETRSKRASTAPLDWRAPHHCRRGALAASPPPPRSPAVATAADRPSYVLAAPPPRLLARRTPPALSAGAERGIVADSVHLDARTGDDRRTRSIG